jgi:hypothetical protein
MKLKSTGKKISIISVAILLILGTGLWVFGVFDLLSSDYVVEEGVTRQDIEQSLSDLLVDVETQEYSETTNTKLAYTYYYLGEFKMAEDVISRVVAKQPKAFDAYSLLAELYYLQGKYDESEQLMLEQMQLHPLNVNVQLKAQARLMKIYYQNNQYQKIGDWKALRLMGMGDFMDWLKSFEEAPYQLVWQGEEQTTIPFLAVDPLPIIQFEVQGKPVYALIDTGADAVILDADLASELLAESGLSMQGNFGGGIGADMGFSRAERMQFGNLEMRNVPVMTLSLNHITESFAAEELQSAGLPDDFQVGAIIGTKIFQQVVATMDYPNERLVLQDKKAFNASAFEGHLQGDFSAATFQLAELHTLTCEGVLNGQAAMFWMDSGYADEAAVLVNALTFQDYGINLPELAYHEDAVSGGGTGYESGWMEHFGSAGIGDLILDDVSAGFDPGEDFYWESGYIVEAMLSHAYLKQVAWTIDFEQRTMYFVK